ncbi:MAG: hypothetical protein ACOX83_09880, partial [Candidatus Spyradocola sp.]
DISIVSSDDGLNAAGGTDGSGTSGGRDGMFGGGQVPARPEDSSDAPSLPDSAPSGDATPPDRPETASNGTEERPEAPQAMDGAPDAGRGGRGGMGGMGGGFSSNSDGTIVISGGTLNIQASGDGIDANGSLEITGGTTVVSGPTQGDTSTLDFDTTGTISGGTFIGTGATNMAQTFTDAGQGVVTERVSGVAGSAITLSDAAGNVLLTTAPALDFQLVILSCPDLASGETYTLTVGDTSMEVQAS